MVDVMSPRNIASASSAPAQSQPRGIRGRWRAGAHRARQLLALCAVAATAIGCGSSDDDPSSSEQEIARDEPTGTSTLFFLNANAQGRVLRTEPGDGDATILVDSSGTGAGAALDGVAVDVEGGHVYWTDMGLLNLTTGAVRRAKLDGSDVEVLVTGDDTDTPKQMKLDLEAGKMYWSDREGMRVQRANLDGSDLETLVTAGDDVSDASTHCVGMAIDPDGGYFYWSQRGAPGAGEGSIRRAGIEMPSGMDSTNRDDIEVLFEGLPEPIDLDLDLAAGHLYWTDRGDATVNRASMELPDGATPSDRSDREILVSDAAEAIGISLDLSRGFIYFTELGGAVDSNPLAALSGGNDGNLRRSRLDGSEPEQLLTGFGPLTGVEHVDIP